MKKNLLQSFFQVFTASFIWLTFILNMFQRNTHISMTFLWNVVGVSLICALLFGVLYNALWNYLTLKPIWNITIASVANTTGGLLALFLLFRNLFFLVLNFIPAIFILTIALHTIAFYFYGKYTNKKQVNFLNDALKNK